MFDPNLYGEEEFGPEDNNHVKKKGKRKKKETKAILTFGNKRAPEHIRNAVKQSHNLATPGAKRVKRVVKPRLADAAPGVQTSPEISAAVINEVTDVSTGAQNYFESELHHGERSGLLGDSLVQAASKQYMTPTIPKKVSRLQKDNSSTPNLKTSSAASSQTVKDQIKNNFGFDSEEDLR